MYSGKFFVKYFDKCFANIFTQSVDFIFIFLAMSLVKQKFLVLMKFNLVLMKFNF